MSNFLNSDVIEIIYVVLDFIWQLGMAVFAVAVAGIAFYVFLIVRRAARVTRSVESLVDLTKKVILKPLRALEKGIDQIQPILDFFAKRDNKKDKKS